MCNNSTASSKLIVSLPPGVHTGNRRERSPGIRSVASNDSRALIQLRLACTVLISPLWAMNRYGCASGHVGKVLVEKRLCTSAMADSIRVSVRSGKNGCSCRVVSMPL